jgi:hypothetical protein
MFGSKEAATAGSTTQNSAILVMTRRSNLISLAQSLKTLKARNLAPTTIPSWLRKGASSAFKVFNP